MNSTTGQEEDAGDYDVMAAEGKYSINCSAEYPKTLLTPLIRTLLDDAEKLLCHVGNINPIDAGISGVHRIGYGKTMIAIFKPRDEEPNNSMNPKGWSYTDNSSSPEGFRFSFRPGESAVGEMAAYILDYPIGGHFAEWKMETGFAGVPPTLMVDCQRPGYKWWKDNVITGSLQKYVKGVSMKSILKRGISISNRHFSIQEVHKIVIIDIRFGNVDRNTENLIVDDDDHIIPIDHGFCFAWNFDKIVDYAWISLPHYSEKFTPESKEYVRLLNSNRDIELFNKVGIHFCRDEVQIHKSIHLCTTILKKGILADFSPKDFDQFVRIPLPGSEVGDPTLIMTAMERVLEFDLNGNFLERCGQVVDGLLTRYFNFYPRPADE